MWPVSSTSARHEQVVATSVVVRRVRFVPGALRDHEAGSARSRSSLLWTSEITASPDFFIHYRLSPGISKWACDLGHHAVGGVSVDGPPRYS